MPHFTVETAAYGAKHDTKVVLYAYERQEKEARLYLGNVVVNGIKVCAVDVEPFDDDPQGTKFVDYEDLSMAQRAAALNAVYKKHDQLARQRYELKDDPKIKLRGEPSKQLQRVDAEIDAAMEARKQMITIEKNKAYAVKAFLGADAVGVAWSRHYELD